MIVSPLSERYSENTNKERRKPANEIRKRKRHFTQRSFGASAEDSRRTTSLYDLPGEIKEKQPDLLPLLDKIREEVKNIRDRLRPIYGKLPKSLFHSEEQRNNQLLSEDGHLIGLCDFNDGGFDTCIAHFLHVAMITDEELPEDYVWLEANDPDVRQKRLDSLIHSFRVIGKEYNFSEDELAALPLVYKIMLFGGVYYYGTVFRLMDNHDQLKELLEYILNQLFTDQIDFGKILAKTNK